MGFVWRQPEKSSKDNPLKEILRGLFGNCPSQISSIDKSFLGNFLREFVWNSNLPERFLKLLFSIDAQKRKYVIIGQTFGPSYFRR